MRSGEIDNSRSKSADNFAVIRLAPSGDGVPKVFTSIFAMHRETAIPVPLHDILL